MGPGSRTTRGRTRRAPPLPSAPWSALPSSPPSLPPSPFRFLPHIILLLSSLPTLRCSTPILSPLSTAVIQKLLDECLLTEEEMALGPEKWKETMDHLDPIGLALEEVASKQVEEKENLEGNKSGAKKRKGDDVSGISPEKKAVIA